MACIQYLYSSHQWTYSRTLSGLQYIIAEFELLSSCTLSCGFRGLIFAFSLLFNLTSFLPLTAISHKPFFSRFLPCFPLVSDNVSLDYRAFSCLPWDPVIFPHWVLATILPLVLAGPFTLCSHHLFRWVRATFSLGLQTPFLLGSRDSFPWPGLPLPFPLGSRHLSPFSSGFLQIKIMWHELLLFILFYSARVLAL